MYFVRVRRFTCFAPTPSNPQTAQLNPLGLLPNPTYRVVAVVLPWRRVGAINDTNPHYHSQL